MAKISSKYYLPVIIWAMLILTVSSIPHLKTPDLGLKIDDKIAHFCEYFIFGLLIANMFWRVNKPFPYIMITTSLIGTIYGILDELHQLFIPGRTTDVFDMTADALGVITASLFYVLWRIWKSTRKLPEIDKH